MKACFKAAIAAQPGAELRIEFYRDDWANYQVTNARLIAEDLLPPERGRSSKAATVGDGAQ